MNISGEGFNAYGWIFHPDTKFDSQKLNALFEPLQIERLKAVMKTEDGNKGFNYAGDALEALKLDDLADSRVEVISSSGFDAEAFEARLLDARKL